MNYETDHYEVLLYDFVSAAGEYRHYSTTPFPTEEAAIAFARENHDEFRVIVREVRNIIGWWEE